MSIPFKVTARRTYEYNQLVHANSPLEAQRIAEQAPFWDVNHSLLVDLNVVMVSPLKAGTDKANDELGIIEQEDLPEPEDMDD